MFFQGHPVVRPGRPEAAVETALLAGAETLQSEDDAKTSI